MKLGGCDASVCRVDTGAATSFGMGISKGL